MSPKNQLVVLVVEDDPNIASLVDYRLSREGLSVVHAADGEQAMEQFGKPPPDLVILDVMLPYRDGYELLAELRQRPGWSEVPVIMLTSRSREEDVARGLSIGANDYLVKPFRPAELVARVQRLLAPK